MAIFNSKLLVDQRANKIQKMDHTVVMGMVKGEPAADLPWLLYEAFNWRLLFLDHNRKNLWLKMVKAWMGICYSCPPSPNRSRNILRESTLFMFGITFHRAPGWAPRKRSIWQQRIGMGQKNKGLGDWRGPQFSVTLNGRLPSSNLTVCYWK